MYLFLSERNCSCQKPKACPIGNYLLCTGYHLCWAMRTPLGQGTILILLTSSQIQEQSPQKLQKSSVVDIISHEPYQRGRILMTKWTNKYNEFFVSSHPSLFVVVVVVVFFCDRLLVNCRLLANSLHEKKRKHKFQRTTRAQWFIATVIKAVEQFE